MNDLKTPEVLAAATRQYRTSWGEKLVMGLDYDDVVQIMVQLVAKAHMAGQANAGADPSYSDAQQYCTENMEVAPLWGYMILHIGSSATQLRENVDKHL